MRPAPMRRAEPANQEGPAAPDGLRVGADWEQRVAPNRVERLTTALSCGERHRVPAGRLQSRRSRACGPSGCGCPAGHRPGPPEAHAEKQISEQYAEEVEHRAD